MAFRVLIDACVLINYPITDLLLRLAEADLYQPVWSAGVLDEVERNLVAKLGLLPEKARRRVNAMRSAFPAAEATGYSALISAMRNDPKDRHVLAAAVHAHCALIVTANLKDFPPQTLEAYGIEAVHPDDFLLDQLDLDTETTLRCLDLQHRALKRPAMTRAEFYDSLRVGAPNFVDAAEQLHDDLGELQPAADPSMAGLPIPIVAVTPEALEQAFLPAGPLDALTPEGVVYHWWSNLMEPDHPDAELVLTKLSYNPEHWPDNRALAQSLRGRSLAQARHPDTRNPNFICYFKVIDFDVAGRVFAQFPVSNTLYIMLVRHDIFEPWRVLAIGPAPWEGHDDAGGPGPGSVMHSSPPEQPEV